MNLSIVSEHLQTLRARLAQNANVCVSIANRVNAALLVFDDQMIDLQTGRTTRLVQSKEGSDLSPEAQIIIDAKTLAEAASRLLSDNHQTEKVCVLLLPPSEFLMTDTNLPAAGLDIQRSALLLQAMTILPEFEQPLTVGFMPSQRQGPLPSVKTGLATWLPAARTEHLFTAFSDQKIFLASIMPRIAFFTDRLGNPGSEISPADNLLMSVEDSDRQLTTVLKESQHATLVCLQCAANDLAVPELREKFILECGDIVPTRHNVRLASAQDYMSANLLKTDTPQASQHNLHANNLARLAVKGIFPDAALAARHQLEQGRLRKDMMKTALAAVLILSVPFIWQSIQLFRLGADLSRAQVLSEVARADQAVVRDFENNWGAFTEFPDQDIAEVLLTLQPVINPGLLSAFELDEGLLGIEGESPDPQNILEQLEQNPMFTEVDFARATNNNRYFIELRLSTVNFSAYREWHFPEPR
ncbi:hypothetical protein E3V39_05040 [Gammaproteobacteria bacterium LSUCC0112]|nr:hypothetical protein E3V39_05040 [Gammaproteobacteria bacterium LSUCC0112]